MSLQLNRSGVVNNQLTFNCQLLYSEEPQSLVGLTLLAVVKASKTATDGSGTSYAEGTGLTVTTAGLGKFTWVIPAANNTVAGTFWYRIDAINGASAPVTSMFGTLTILPA